MKKILVLVLLFVAISAGYAQRGYWVFEEGTDLMNDSTTRLIATEAVVSSTTFGKPMMLVFTIDYAEPNIAITLGRSSLRDDFFSYRIDSGDVKRLNITKSETHGFLRGPDVQVVLRELVGASTLTVQGRTMQGNVTAQFDVSELQNELIKIRGR